MAYTFLSESLHKTADTAREFFRRHYGLTRMKIEEPIADTIQFRPTFKAESRDNHIYCFEVSESQYPAHLDSVVISMRDEGLPVRLFIVNPIWAIETRKPRTPPSSSRTEHDISEEGTKPHKVIQKAKDRGIGIAIVEDSTVKIINDALLLSCAGLRPYRTTDFPPRYREALNSATQTFRGGNPVQGCHELYSEIEALTRRIALKVEKKKLWKDNDGIGGLNLDTGSWFEVSKSLRDKVKWAQNGCPDLRPALLNQLCGITGHRNDTGHKPGNRRDLIKRDARLRTRFESGVDLLKELIDASKPLRP